MKKTTKINWVNVKNEGMPDKSIEHGIFMVKQKYFNREGKDSERVIYNVRFAYTTEDIYNISEDICHRRPNSIYIPSSGDLNLPDGVFVIRGTDRPNYADIEVLTDIIAWAELVM